MNPAVELAERAADEDAYEHTLTGGELLELRAGDAAELGYRLARRAMSSTPSSANCSTLGSPTEPDPNPRTTCPGFWPFAWPTTTTPRRPRRGGPWPPAEDCRPAGGSPDAATMSRPRSPERSAPCAVVEPCLESARAEEGAFAVKDRFGIRGGLTAAERAG